MKRISRRKFLDNSTKAASGATAAAVASSAVRAESLSGLSTRRASPNDRIRAALIGCGGRGKSVLRDFLRNGRVDCLAVGDVDESRVAQGRELVAERRGKKPDSYADFRHIIDRNDIDVIIIGTPDHWHALPTIYACQAGKDVYVEKPLATSIAEGRAMVKAAHKHRRIVQVGTQQRSAQHFADAVKFVQSGQLGKIRLVRTWAYIDWKGGMGNPPNQSPPAGVDYDMWLGPAPERPFNPSRFHFTFRWFWDYSGGLMTDWGAHMVDIVMWAMKEDPIGAMAVGGKYGYPNDIMETPDTQQSIVEFPSFSMVWEHMIGAGVGPWQREHGVEFHGQNGVLVVDRAGWELHSETERIDRPDRIYRMKPVPRQRGSRDYTFTHIENFLECIESRRKPVAEAEIGHQSVNACHLANIAARLRRYVRWDARKERIVGDSEAQKMVSRKYRKPWKLAV